MSSQRIPQSGLHAQLPLSVRLLTPFHDRDLGATLLHLFHDRKKPIDDTE